MSDEINPIPLTPAPTSTWAKLKKWWPSIPSAAFLAMLVGVLWPHGKTAQVDPQLVVIYSGFQTNWDATVQSSHDPRLPVAVLTLTNGALATNMNNLIVRRAEIHRTTLIGFRAADGGFVPVAQAGIIAGTIAQTNGINTIIVAQLHTNR